ncbi:hypothetical protein BST97_02475 [Nonlabens spongiae]|uniref:Uncharacterized protein n=1 Tax=Nonlabens spongiae TaxID=331648 RepID=A0A1W6MH89_9FLAO|nr:hypothetical protein [Nonlabens spongiae]ARN76955.1 hypothetical protein BST97_02475 [Nonlabens spongiae]
MLRKIISIFIVVSTSFLGHSQNKKAYKLRSKIITAKDTIHCFLTNDEGFEDEIEYKLGIEKDSPLYRINTVHVLKIDQGAREFYNIQYKGKSKMVKSIVDGTVRLFEYNEPTSFTYFDHDQSSPTYRESRTVFNMDKPKYYLEKDGEIFYLGKGNKKKTLRKALTGNPEVTEMINDLDNSLIRFRLRNIVKKYNFWLTEKD